MTKEDLSANNGQGRCGRCTTHAQCISAQRCVKEDLSKTNDDTETLRPEEYVELPRTIGDSEDAALFAQSRLDAFPALGELPVHDNAKPADPERFASHRPLLSGVRIPASEVESKQAAWLAESQRRIDEHEALQAKRAFRMRKFSTLTDAEVKEVMAYDLTPRALKALRSVDPTVKEVGTLKPSDLLLMNALAGDGLELPAGKVEQLRPPPVPEVTSPAFKMGVFCGLLVGSGVMAALPYIVELLK